MAPCFCIGWSTFRSHTLNFTFDNAVNTGVAGGGVTVANTGVLTIAALADMTLDGAFDQSGGGTVSTAGDITTTADAIAFTDPVTLIDNVLVDSPGGGG